MMEQEMLKVIEKPTGKGPDCGCSTATSSCCGPAVLIDDFNLSKKIPGWVTGNVSTAAGVVPQISTALRSADIIGGWKARWDMGRMNYAVSPGLYAVGAPGKESPVLVSANYKMSFDRLRKELTGIDAWIMVLDTKGINVWCAAGKGTFGTAEIVERLGRTRLAEIVSHGTLIVPQLGAPGVAAHEVHRQTGFRVIYGPVRAEDLPAFLKAGNKATPEMREVHFGLLDRLVLTPVELVAAIKPALILLLVLFVVNLVADLSAPFLSLVAASLVGFIPFLGATLAGTMVVPVLLPFIPGRSFAWKGWLVGLAWAVLFLFLSDPASWRLSLFYLLVLPPISSYLALNLTGGSTYTSLSGVVREMKFAIPAVIVSAVLGLAFLATGLIVKF